MTITMQELTIAVDEPVRGRLLDKWTWLVGDSKAVILVSAGGDAFFQDRADGSVHLLDVAAGEVLPVSGSVDEFRTLLQDQEFVSSHFAVAMVVDARNHGLILEPGEVYSFKHPPVLGGAFAFDNLEKSDVEIHFDILGQIHQQVASLPPGTPIDSVKLQ